MTNKECHVFEFEIRAGLTETEGEEKKNTHEITGRPIVFNADTDLGYYVERIAPEALNDTDLRDVRFLVNHDTSMIPLARSRNNNANSTMQMVVGEEGMDIRVDLDVENNPKAAELYSAVSRGDVSGMSFMFTVEEDAWAGLDTDHPTRTITKIGRVMEVSAVTFPAYQQTSIEAASASDALDRAKDALESAKAEQRKKDMAAEIKKILEGGNS